MKEPRHMRVLLIEDDEDDYVLVKDLLSETLVSRIDLDWVVTYDAGLTRICRGRYDVCLLDFHLGEHTGLELLHEASRNGCDVPIILLTGQGRYEVDVEAMKAGAADYLVKEQISANLLERAIRYSIERKHVEKELKRYRNDLEELVRERTIQLERANERLQKEVAERKQAEEEVVRQNDFLTTILESLSHPFYVVDARDYSVKIANSAAAPGGLLPGSTCHALTHRSEAPCTNKEHHCPLEAVKRARRPVTTEHTHHDENGKERYVEVHAHPIFDSRGDVVQVIQYALDITERKTMEEALLKARDELEIRVHERTAELMRANEALRLDESRLEALLELSRMSKASIREIADFALEQQVRLTKSKIGAIGFLNEDETILTVHAWSKEIRKQCPMKNDKDGLIRLPIERAGLWAQVVRERKAMIINDYPRSSLRSEECHECPIELTRIMSVPVLDGNCIAAIALLANKEEDYDASDARQSTLIMDGVLKLIQRDRSDRALRESESLAAMGRALSGLAHDIKTPLVAIGGFARQVQKHIERGHPDWDKLEIVLKETGRLEKMVRDMLDFSRPLQLERSLEDISRVTEESLAVLEGTARKRRVKIESLLASDLPAVSLDAMRMKQVIINLVLNAVQATGEGETVRVRTHQKPGRVIIDVTDCGSGIPPDRREDVFLPFVTTKKEGTGLGLPIVKKIVEAHGGRVEILDNSEKGITFRVGIPALSISDGYLKSSEERS